MRAFPIFLAVLVLAGCNAPQEGGQQPPGTQDPSTASPTSTTSASGLPPPPTPGLNFSATAFWSGCTGFRTLIAGLTEMFDFPPPPPGWESDNPTTGFDLRFFSCDRVSWGQFERGPIYMIVEMGGSFINPESCNGENATLMRNLSSWWFSDQEVASYAASAYGMNAYYADIQVSRDDVGSAHQETWTWALQGQAESHATFPDADTPTQPTTHTTRIFWFVGNGVYAVDFTQHWDALIGFVQGSGPQPAVGRLEDPMLYSTSSDFNDFQGQSEPYRAMDLAGNFYRFGDLQCEQPL